MLKSEISYLKEGDSIICTESFYINGFLTIYKIEKNKVYKVLKIVNYGASIDIDNSEVYIRTCNLLSKFELCTPKTKINKVNHPSHYTWLKDKCGIEVIDIVRHLDFDTGNAIKYLLRAGHKSEEGYNDKDKTIEDLKKAAWYINDKIKQLSNKE